MKKWIALSALCLIGAAGMQVSAADAVKDAQDIQFITSAAQGGMTEVRAAQIALKHASNDEVKKFAEQMVSDHTKANEQLKQAAQDKKIDVPADLDKMHQDKLAKLEKASGADFDKEYMKAMLGDHLETIALFQHEADNGNIHEIKKFAADTLPTLKHHMAMAEQTNKDIGGDPITAGGKIIGTKDITGKDKDGK